MIPKRSTSDEARAICDEAQMYVSMLLFLADAMHHETFSWSFISMIAKMLVDITAMRVIRAPCVQRANRGGWLGSRHILRELDDMSGHACAQTGEENKAVAKIA